MTRPLKILYHHRTQGRGAEGNHIVSIVTALRSLGHEVLVLSPPGVDPFDPASTLPVDKTRTQTRGWASLWKWMSRRLPNWIFELAELAYNLPAWWRLRRILSNGGFDLVYERYAFFLLAGAFAARRAGCDFVLEANEVSGVASRARRQSFVRLCSALERVLIRRCTLIHAVSSFLGTSLVGAGLDPRRLIVVPNGFEPSRLRLNVPRDQMRSRLGMGMELIIGFAGWFDRWDRLDFLGEVFVRVRSQRSGVKLCLVGAGPGVDEIRHIVSRNGLEGQVIFTGAVSRDQVYDHLQTFDIGILPHSNQFGSPIVMFEMMALGIPLVLPKLPPILDVHDERSASLFDLLDVSACARRLVELVDDASRRSDLAGESRRRLAEHHSWRGVAQRIMDRWSDRPWERVIQ